MRQSLSFFSSIFFLFLVIIPFLALVDGNNVSDTCRTAAQIDKNVHFDFCVKALGGDPKSHSTDLQGQEIISLNLIIKNATKIGSGIRQLLNDQTLSPYVKTRLKDCLKGYGDAIYNTRVDIVAINSKDYSTTTSNVNSARDALSDCEDGFKKKLGSKSPLTAENNGFFQLTAIALAINNMVAHGIN